MKSHNLHTTILRRDEPDRVKERANLVGRIVWKIVTNETKDKTGRSIYLLAGLRPEHLEGISRMIPMEASGKIELKIRKDIDDRLTSNLPEDHLTNDSAVHFRNSDAADIILFAVSDEERETVGASLNPVSRIDRNSIQDQSDLWASEIMAGQEKNTMSEERRNWIKDLVKGLNFSGVTKELDQFAEFILSLRERRSLPWNDRIWNSAPALHLPTYSFARIPGLENAQTNIQKEFRSMFRGAEQNIANFAYLLDKTDNRIDTDKLLEHLHENEDNYNPREKKQSEAIRNLVADYKHLRHGTWRQSQEYFCQTVDWKNFGKNVFGIQHRRPTPDLSERTREFLYAEFPKELENNKEAQQYLEDLATKNTTPEEDQNFFHTWQNELLSASDRKLYEAWRRYLFPNEVTSDDLQVAILEGVHALLMKTADDNGKIATGGKIEIRARHYDKLSTWSSLDKRVYALFRQEARLLQNTLSSHIVFNFGQWLNKKAIQKSTRQTKKDARQIEFEMELISEDGSNVSPPHLVRVFWKPSSTSIAMAWPEDIEGLYQGITTDGFVRIVHPSTIVMKPSGEVSGSLSSLKDTSSFSDVMQGENGRTADPASALKEKDFFTIILNELYKHEADRHIDTSTKEVVAAALRKFQECFTDAIKRLATDPETLYGSDLIQKQARAFGQLCKTVREKLGDRSTTRETTMRKVTEFGIITSATTEEIAIIPAWHPLRLLERQAKAQDLAAFVKTLLNIDSVSDSGMKRACDERRYLYQKWFFPEIISIGFKIYTVLQDCAGYSLAVPVEAAASDPQKLDATATAASKQFLMIADRYLELNPHEEGNFSTAIFNAETISLPGLIAKGLEDRMRQNNHLRCILLITHEKPEIMRNIYATQNTILRIQNLDEVTEGFLSRLRIKVGKGNTTRNNSRRNNTDIVLLHDVFFKQSKMKWDYLDHSSDALEEEVDFRNIALPRRQTGDMGMGKTIEMSLSVTHPPRAAAEFLDLCHSCREDTVQIQEGKRALPLRRVSWDKDSVKSTIERAHNIGEWVVSVDSMSSRQMLSDNGIKVIRDVALPDSELRVLVSSREPNTNLLRHIRADFECMADQTLNNNANSIADRVVSMVVEVCGQKILSSARSKSVSREIIGLAAAITLVRIDKIRSQIKPPVWFSLDDNRAFLGLTGKMADALALVVSRAESGRFIVDMSVVEAKCIATQSSAAEAKSSCEQVSSTLKTIKANFVDQKDPLAKQAWSTQLLQLMSLRPEYVHFLSISELHDFRIALARGEIEYRAEGRSVVVVHDDDTSNENITATLSPSDDDVWQYRVGQRALGCLMKVIENPESPDAPEIPIPEGLPDPKLVLVGRQTNDSIPNSNLVTPTEDATPKTIEPISLYSKSPSKEEPAEKKVSMTEPQVVDMSNPRIRPELEKALKSVMMQHGGNENKEQDDNLSDNIANRLQAALTELGMHAKFTFDPTISTPNGVLVNFSGHSTLTVKKLESKLPELKTTFALNVTDIRAGLGRISLFVASQERKIVDLCRVWLEAKWPKNCPDYNPRFLIGIREDNGDPLWLNLQGSYGGNEEHAPHTLIAGETGSGKGVLTQNILLQMIAFNQPKNFKLYVIDPKFGIDFFWISEAPHLAREIVTDQKNAELILNEIVDEMNRRYELFRQKRVPKISEYNARVSDEEKLPLIVVVHDEMADWMAGSRDYRRVVEACFTRIAAKARACGIHIIMITQRAAQEAIPVGIRDNLGNRICLKVAGDAGSILALGVKGAERLLGKGHFAARLGGERPSGEDYFLAQVPFATTEDLEIFARAALK